MRYATMTMSMTPDSPSLFLPQENRIREILSECNPYGLDLGGAWLEKVFSAYRQPHRYFHTVGHLLDICEGIRREAWEEPSLAAELLLTALFHDVVWYPQGKDSEERSVEAFQILLGQMGDPLPPPVKERIRCAILSTRDQENVSEMAARFHNFDCQVIIQGSHVDLLAYEFQHAAVELLVEMSRCELGLAAEELLPLQQMPWHIALGKELAQDVLLF